jgi:hypothetical protein
MPEGEQQVVLEGKKLLDKDGKEMGTIVEQLTILRACDQHEKCPGPIVRFRWADGRLRRECIYVLIKYNKYKLSE